MAGPDTFRGCSFQAAYAVRLALDVLEGRAETLKLEGDDDIVDAALQGPDGEVLLVTQAKSKVEPYTWGPGPICDAIGRWLETDRSPEERFEFATNGSLGPSAARKLAPALERLRAGELTDEDRTFLQEKDLDLQEPALARVWVRSHLPSGRDLLLTATLRVRTLHERVGPITVEQAGDIVDRLFRATMLGSGEQEASERELSREEIAELVGVPVTLIDEAEPWSAAVEEEYRAAVAEIDLDPSWTLLDLLAAERPRALTFVEPRAEAAEEETQPAPADSLLESASRGVLISGPAGAGKTTTLSQLRLGALERAQLPLLVSFSTYSGEGLEAPIRRSIESVLSRPLAPGAVPTLLAREEAVVLIDGVGELPTGQREALLSDFRALRESFPQGARFVLVAREVGSFAASFLAGFSLLGLDRERRLEIAAAVLAEPEREVEAIEVALGGLVDNPLLYTMALGLRAKSDESPETRAGLFEGFLEGIQARPEGTQLSAAALACLRIACFDLRAGSRYSADEWWWLQNFTESRAELIERGSLDPQATSAQELLADGRRAGLLRELPGGGELGLLHDLFADWLAAAAIRDSLRALPDPVPEPLEEASVFLAEAGPLDPEQILALATNPVACARVALIAADLELDLELSSDVWRRLRSQLGAGLRERFEGLHLRAAGEPLWAYLSEAVESGDPAESALRTLALGPASTLSLPLDLWLAALRLELMAQRWTMPTVAPEDDQAMAELIERVADERQAATRVLLDDLLPGLAERIERVIGPQGIRGWLLPGCEVPGVPGTGQMVRHHELAYRHSSGPSEVALMADREQVPAEATGQMAAEIYVVEAPQRAVRKSLEKALTSLIPRFDA